MILETLGKKMTVPALAVMLGVGACSTSTELLPPPPTSTSKSAENCNGLPPYKIVGMNKEGEPMLQVVDGTTCETGMFDHNTDQNLGSSIGPATTFFACVREGRKPLSFRTTVTAETGVGPVGTVNLGNEAAEQWRAAHDVPVCTTPEPSATPSSSPAPSGDPSFKA